MGMMSTGQDQNARVAFTGQMHYIENSEKQVPPTAHAQTIRHVQEASSIP